MNAEDFMDLRSCVGKTIESIHVCRAEFGRTYDSYTFVIFTDGCRTILGGRPDKPWNPNPILDDVASITPAVFTVDELADLKKQNEAEQRRRKEANDADERRTYETLRAKFCTEET